MLSMCTRIIKRQFLKIHNVSLGKYTKHCLYNKMFKFLRYLLICPYCDQRFNDQKNIRLVFKIIEVTAQKIKCLTYKMSTFANAWYVPFGSEYLIIAKAIRLIFMIIKLTAQKIKRKLRVIQEIIPVSGKILKGSKV